MQYTEERKNCIAESYLITFNEKNKRNELIQVEMNKHEVTDSKYELMYLWVKNGYLQSPLESYWNVKVYATDDKDNCREKYNPCIKREIGRDAKGNITLNHFVVNFDWLLEATEENKQKILREINRRARM